jgi:hypothetical protein
MYALGRWENWYWGLSSKLAPTVAEEEVCDGGGSYEGLLSMDERELVCVGGETRREDEAGTGAGVERSRGKDPGRGYM